MLPLQSFIDFIDQHRLFTPENKILLAVSGGKDSVLMTHLFKEAGFNIGVAHCNFNLRGEESQRDESFVRMLSVTLGVPFFVGHFETKSYAETNKVSIQMAARALRYNWFEEIRENHGYDFIALAQHTDDAIETVLLNLTRGTGISGLHGILPSRGNLIRPLLFLSGADIDQFVATNNIDFVEDSSNATINYARNKIRHQVVPVLRSLNPNLNHTFEHNIQRFTETEAVLKQVVKSLERDLFERHNDAIHIQLEYLRHLNPQKLLLYELFKPYNFTESGINELIGGFESQSGTTFYSSSHRAIIDRSSMVISPIPDALERPVQMVHHHNNRIKFLNCWLTIEHSSIIFFEKELAKAFVDERKLIYPLVIRTRQEGDKFIPLGMTGFKKLSNFFIDEKVPLNEKDEIPLIINGNGEVIWVAGYRQDDRYKINGATREVVVFEIKK
ncbi:MAG: tRNA lysidine(34) synthetase TilS [Bacteroidota bacterium]